MALHKDFPTNPFVVLDPKIRWIPADEDLREQGYEKLLPAPGAGASRRSVGMAGSEL